MLTADLWVAHALSIPLKVIRFGSKFFEEFRVRRLNGPQCLNQVFDFALVEQALLVDFYPDVPVWQVAGMQPARQVPEGLTRVIEIDDLRRAGKNAKRRDSRSIRRRRS